jgi:hypothetical protein
MTANWVSGESPAEGLSVTIATRIVLSTPGITEMIVLTTVIPADFTE